MKLPAKPTNPGEIKQKQGSTTSGRGTEGDKSGRSPELAAATLPDDILRYVVGFGRLNPPDLVRMERVSKSFQALVGAESVWRLVAPKATSKERRSAPRHRSFAGLGETAWAFHQRIRGRTAEEKTMFRLAYDQSTPFPRSVMRFAKSRHQGSSSLLLDDFDFMRAAAAGDRNSSVKNVLMPVSRRLKSDLAFSLSLLLLSANLESPRCRGLEIEVGYGAANKPNGRIDSMFPRLHLYVGYGTYISLLATRTLDNVETRQLFQDPHLWDGRQKTPDVRFYADIQGGQDHEFLQELSAKLHGTIWTRDLSVGLTKNLLRIGYDSHEKVQGLMSVAERGETSIDFDRYKNPSPWKKVLSFALDASEVRKMLPSP